MCMRARRNPIFKSESYSIYAMNPISFNSKLKFNKYGNISIVGDLPTLKEEVEYEIECVPVMGKYGMQYVVQKISRDKPTTPDQMANFLKEVLTERQANTLLDAYPNIVDMIIKNEEVDLSKTKGIKEKLFAKIKEKVVADFCLLELVDKYSSFGISMSIIKKLYRRYKSVERVVEKMEKDPYDCLCKISGIGFKTADVSILKFKPELLSSTQRMTSCIEYHLDENEKTGSTMMKETALYNQCDDLVRESMRYFYDVIGNKERFYIEEKQIAKNKTYECEDYIARKVLELIANTNPLKIDYTKYSVIDNISLTDQQMQALGNLCRYMISCLGGYAGSGKTQTTKAIIDMLEDNGLTYKLFAPTGRASQVLQEYTNRNASTIHRGLGFNPDLGWKHNKDNPLRCDVLIVDEFSMTDVFLMKHILEAVAEGTRVVLILDPEQLPSVGAGNVGYDLMKSGLLPVTILTQIFRYGEGGLMQVATDIRDGVKYINNGFVGVKSFGINKDYSLISADQTESMSYIRNIITELLKRGNDLKDIIVLSAMNKGDYGTVAINQTIQQHINPPRDGVNEIVHRHTTFREGDRVMQIKNNYSAITEQYGETVIFNGDIGTVKFIKDDIMVVEYGDKSILYEDDDFDKLVLGYCITIHKSQGSAFKHVILVNPKAHKFFLNKNLLYVGVTRAKERVYHITTPDVINSSIKKQIIRNRLTMLKRRMIEINFCKVVGNSKGTNNA